jgi:hypothetical protein
MTTAELGQNIRYDPQAVVEGRRRDLLDRAQYYEDGISRAEANNNRRDINLFYARIKEIERSLDESFPIGSV